MLTIIITVILAIVLLVAFAVNDFEKIGPVIVAFILVGGFVLGLAVPVSGYKEWRLTEETELVTLSNGLASGGTGLVYVSLSADNAYTYRYEIDSEFGTETGKTYKTQTLVGEDVEEVEDPNCKQAVVRVYQREGKKSIWTFAFWTKETKYIFYVPEGTISKEVKLK